MILITIVLFALLFFISYGLAAYAVRGLRCTLSETAAEQREKYPWTAKYIDVGDNYTISGYEGYVLHATHIKSPSGDGKHFVILTHGHTATRHGCLKYAPIFIDRGYDCIIYDLRGHGENLYQGNSKKKPRIGREQICFFSKKESQDLLCVIADTRKRFGNDIIIGLHGESLGAASTIAALRYKPDVSFAVEDCGFADIINVQKVVLRNMHLPTWLVYPASIISKFVYGYSFTDIHPEYALKDNNVPLLVIHGGEDDFIVPENGKRIYDAQHGFKRIEIFPNAAHAQSLLSNPSHYAEVVNNFLDSINM